MALLNTINVHAVLAGGLSVGEGDGGSGGPASGFGAATGPGAAGSISLPVSDLARSEPVVIAVALGQTVIFAGLLVAWLMVVAGPLVSGRLGQRGKAALGA